MGLRTKALDTIEQTVLPRQSSQRVQQMDSARQIQLQQALGGGAVTQAPALTPTSAAQAVAQMTKAQGQQIVGVAQQEAQQRAQVEEQRQRENSLQKQQQLIEKSQAVRKLQTNLQQELAAFDARTKQELFDNQMTFQKDDLGRTLFNEQQLADYALSKAKTQEELAKYEMQAQQASERRLQLLRAAHAKIQQAATQTFTSEQTELDQQTQLALIEKKRQIEEKIKREQTAARNRASIWTAAGTIVGVSAGAAASMLPGMQVFAPALISGGAAIGGGLGSTAAATTAD